MFTSWAIKIPEEDCNGDETATVEDGIGTKATVVVVVVVESVNKLSSGSMSLLTACRFILSKNIASLSKTKIRNFLYFKGFINLNYLNQQL